MSNPRITTLFTDIGGVLLTNGWDRALRTRTAEKFGLDPDEMNERHHLTYDTYEVGKMGLDEYLDRVVFYTARSFTREALKQWILDQARAHDDTMQLVRDLRQAHNLKIAVVSNEGRELAIDRIARFRLSEFTDFYIVSSFVHFRKPDKDIFRLALDVAQVAPENVAYLEDRPMFAEVAQTLGINSIHHINAEKSRAALNSLGLALPRS
jgi:putative hydrolase of the HAD superfamily